MSETESIGDLIKAVIPEYILRRIEEGLKNCKSPEERFAIIVKGLPDMTKFYQQYERQFQEVLDDFMVCIRCDGNCKTGCSRFIKDTYTDIDNDGFELNGGRAPSFKIFRCPGVVKRKEAITRRLKGNG